MPLNLPSSFPSTWEEIEPFYLELLGRECNSTEALEEWLLDRAALSAWLRDAHRTLRLAFTQANTAENEAALQQFEKVILAKSYSYWDRTDRYLTASPHVAALKSGYYGVFLRDTAERLALFREESIVDQVQVSELNNNYTALCAEVRIPFRGKEYTTSQMNPFRENADRDIRREAFLAHGEAMHKVGDQIEEILDQQIGLRDKIARTAGCSGVEEYVFRSQGRFDYGARECEEFGDAVAKHIVPLVAEIRTRRRDALGIDRYRPWDSGAPLPDEPQLKPFSTPDELLTKSERALQRMNPELGEIFTEMLARNEIDSEARPKKAPGGYMMFFDRARRPVIFMNSSGVQRDVTVLFHEFGHVVHSLGASTQKLSDYFHAPSEIAETASTSMEYFSLDFFDEFYQEHEAQIAKRRYLESSVTLLCWIAEIDLFQRWIYRNPAHSRGERRDKWLEIDARFSPVTDWSGLESHRERSWHSQLHIFAAPFYYIEYGIADVAAVKLWQRFKQDPQATIAQYRKGLSLGGSRPLPELFQSVGVEFRFGDRELKELADTLRNEMN